MKNFLKDTAALIGGGILFAFGLSVFAAPNHILTGGAGGIAIIINNFTGLPLGTGILLVNIPLIATAFFVCGKLYTLKTLYAVALFSAVNDLFSMIVPAKYTENVLLAAIYGGILTGLGLFIIMSRSIVTGGSDLLAYIIQRIRPGKSISTLVLIIDGVIVLLGAVIYSDLETALYSMALIIIMTLVLDNFLRGRSRANVYFIFSSNPDRIKECITALGRGFTVIDAKGGYTGDRNTLIMCAVTLGQSATLRRLIFEADESAFIILASADSIYGNGFTTPNKEVID